MIWYVLAFHAGRKLKETHSGEVRSKSTEKEIRDSLSFSAFRLRSNGAYAFFYL